MDELILDDIYLVNFTLSFWSPKNLRNCFKDTIKLRDLSNNCSLINDYSGSIGAGGYISFIIDLIRI